MGGVWGRLAKTAPVFLDCAPRTPAESPMTEAVPLAELLAQLESLHETLLDQLDELDARIRSVLAEYAPPRQVPLLETSPAGGDPPLPLREAA